MKILVTGAGGFLGRRLVGLLAERHDVVAVARRPLDGVDTVVADLAGDVPSLPAPLDAVIHLAQSLRYREWPEGAADMYAINVGATFRLAEHARTAGARHFVLASTGAVYAPVDSPLTEDSALGPNGFYPRTKLAAEVIVEGYSGDLVTAVLRPFAIYGPGQQGTVVARLAAQVHAGEEVVVQGDPGLRINPVHVDDAARAFAAALDLERSATVNVAGEDVVTLSRLAMLLGDISGTPASIRHEPGLSATLVGDTTRMRERLGPARIGLRGGLADVLSRLGAPAS